MGQQTVTLHLSKTNSAHLFTTFHWLMRQHIVRSGGTRLRLIADHMPEALVVNAADENVNLHLDALNAGVHRLIAVIIVALFHELLTKVVNDVVVLVLLKRFNIDEFAI